MSTNVRHNRVREEAHVKMESVDSRVFVHRDGKEQDVNFVSF